ncbi:hypothetical protein MHYP_G00362070 [Metynnis hypsauchen]
MKRRQADGRTGSVGVAGCLVPAEAPRRGGPRPSRPGPGGPRGRTRVPTRTVAEEIREKGPARVQSRRRSTAARRTPGPPSGAPRRGAALPDRPRAPDPPAPPSGEGGEGGTGEATGFQPRGNAARRAFRREAKRRDERDGRSPSRGAGPAPLRTPARPTQPLEPILIPKLRI